MPERPWMGLPVGQPIGLGGRRGPGQPGSTRRSPGEYLSRAAGFAAGMLLDGGFLGAAGDGEDALACGAAGLLGERAVGDPYPRGKGFPDAGR